MSGDPLGIVKQITAMSKLDHEHKIIMEKRDRIDRYATAAMQCLSAGQMNTDPIWMSKRAYEIAEAMEAERNKRIGDNK